MKKINFEEALNHLPDPIAITSSTGKVKYFNKAGLDLIGKTPEEIFGKNFSKLNFVEKESLKRIKKEMAYFLLTGKDKKQKYDIKIKDKDGNLKILELNARLISRGFRGGEWMVSLRDLTIEREYEQKIKKEKDKLKNYLNVSGVIFVALDLEGKILMINKIGEELLGLTEKKLIGKKWIENFIPKKSKKETKKVFSKVIKGDEKIMESPTRNPIISKKGERMILWKNQPLKDDKGKIIGTISSGEDITEFEFAKQKLTEKEIEYKELFEKMINGFARHKVVRNKKGEIVDYIFLETNKSFEKITGLKKELITNKKISEIYKNQEEVEKWVKIYSEIIESDSPKEFEEYSSELKKWFSIKAYPQDKEYFITIFEDITNKKKSEKESDKFNRFSVGRELKMIELKKEIKELKKELNKNVKEAE